MCWAALDQFCESLALNEQHKLSRFRSISRSKCHTWHCWCPSAHLLCTLNPTHIWAWTTHSQMLHSILIHPQMSHERVGKRKHFHLDRQETQQCATAMSQCSLLGLGEVAKELFCFLPIDATQQHELRWQVFISCNISLWQLLPPLTFWCPLVCDPGSLSTLLCFRPLVGFVWQRRCWSQEDGWLRLSIFVFCFLKLWTWCWQVHLSSCKSYSPWFCQAPVAAFAVYPFAPCGCKRLVHKHRRFLLDPKKNPMGKSHMKSFRKLDQLKKKNRKMVPIFIWEKLVFIYHLVLRGDRQQSRIPTIFRCEVLLWLADLPLTDRGSCFTKEGTHKLQFFFWGEWNSWTLIHWGFSHIFVARMHINHINSQAVSIGRCQHSGDRCVLLPLHNQYNTESTAIASSVGMPKPGWLSRCWWRGDSRRWKAWNFMKLVYWIFEAPWSQLTTLCQGLGAVASKCKGLRSFSIYWNVRARNLHQMSPRDCRGSFRTFVYICYHAL